jgi:FixJ family two-component response regulator
LFDQSQISIVDDDQSFRDSMRRLLKSLNYAVAVFPSAAEFLASPELAATSCLVADVQMPAMTGVELYEYLIETGHAIPTILVTGYPNDGVRERMLTLGVECYLPKPLEEAVLIDCLRSAVAHSKRCEADASTPQTPFMSINNERARDWYVPSGISFDITHDGDQFRNGVGQMKAAASFSASGGNASLEVLWEDTDRAFCKLRRDDADGIGTHSYPFLRAPTTPRSKASIGLLTNTS